MNSMCVDRMNPSPCRVPILWFRPLFVGVLLLLLWPTVGLAFKCNVTATGLSFGGYDALSSVPLSATANIGVTCQIKAKNKASPQVVVISVSAGSSGNFGQRTMTHISGSDVLNYNLYMDAGGSSIWGDGGGGSNDLVANVTTESPVNAKLYGRIPAGQNVLAGSYSDTITVTISY